jgi:hypothetical protein
MVLHELKLILEFPPGCSLYIPSAIITHENISIDTKERRQVITAYTSGNLFQYVDYGFRQSTDVPKSEKFNATEIFDRDLHKMPNYFHHIP